MPMIWGIRNFPMIIGAKSMTDNTTKNTKVGSVMGKYADIMRLVFYTSEIVQAEDRGSLLALLRRSLSYAEIAQAEDRGSLLALLKRSPSYAKVVQAEDRESLLSLLRRSLPYANVDKFSEL